MAYQNIPGPVCMAVFIAVFVSFELAFVSAVHLREDRYTASCTPRKLDISEHHEDVLHVRVRRDVASSAPSNYSDTHLNFTDTYLDETEKHREAYMHWSGNKSNVIFILTRQRNLLGEVISSKLWQSQDYGSHYQKVSLGHPGKEALITFFYVSPANSSRLIFADTANKTLYITHDELTNVKTVTIPFIPDRLKPHPTMADYVLGYTLQQRKLYVSMDFGETWHDMNQDGVTPRVFWADAKYDKNETLVHVEVQTSNGLARYKICSIYSTCGVAEFESSVGSFDPFSMLVIKEYVFVQKSKVFESVMHVSYKRGDFKRAYFPPQTSTKDFLIVNADEGQVFIAVNHLSNANLYLSDATGQFYVLTIANCVFKPRINWFDVDIYEVKGISGTYIVNQIADNNGFRTRISFDKGGNWNDIPTPKSAKTKCNTSDCSIHLMVRGVYVLGILAEAKAPGILMAHGNIGTKLQDGPMSVFISRDGGWTWTQTSLAAGRYKFNILDQGSVLTAIEDASINLTDSVHYSLDEGKTWQTEKFLSSKQIRVDGVLNEPGITSLIASVYGHENKGSIWTVVKLNFSSVLTQKCVQDNYTSWSPADQMDNQNCTLGRKIVYERRKQDSLCYNGDDYRRPTSTKTCRCEKEDFECDYGYIASKASCTKAGWFNKDSIINECQEGKKFNSSNGYRKIAADACTGGKADDDKYKPSLMTCPTVKPGDLKIQTDQPIAATNSDVVFSLIQGKGSKVSTKYLWSFGDDSPAVTKTSLKNSSVKHSFTKHGLKNVTVTATNAKGSVTKSLEFRVEDKITRTIVIVPSATKVNHLTNFDIDVFGPLVSNNQAHIHFLWTFGDEVGNVRPLLSWERRVQHSYSKPGNYTVTAEAINSVSTVYKRYNVQVFEKGIIIRLNFSPNAESYHFDKNIFHKLMFLQLLKVALSLTYGEGANRLVVQIHKTNPVLANVLLVPSKDPQDMSTADFVSRIQTAAKSRTLLIPMDGKEKSKIIYVVGAQLVNDSGPSAPDIKGPNMRAVYIAVPVLLGAAFVTILVIVYYKRKFREVRRYSILRQRSDSDALLGADEDDDPPLDLNPDFGSNDRADDDQLDLGTGSHLVMVTGRGDGGDNSINC
ncbi:VPS10 domain-containing receptor SorCS2-like isoform X1 [Haliotis cracherodii]|uniref:VPS10 domain-containing receptor SorCS2-like isoform X1 n=1 Tax=Haliotis cracherodii TaxID=6455 RepID=UPI0039E7C250